MCGMVCEVSPEGNLAAGDLDAALDAVQHRGPDGRGSWVSPCRRAALGHTRLAVMDPVGGGQPMHSSDGRLHLVANGEFYGHDALRRRLVEEGSTFVSHSDSETALHLWDRHGAAALTQLRGEFAFALWDQARGELVAVRDRFGIKPLYYARHRGHVILASEVGALFAAGVPRRWGRSALADHLVLCHPPDGSVFEGIQQVPPGCWLRTDGRGIHITRYWDLDFPPEAELALGSDRDRHIGAIRSAVVDAVHVRLRADVPVAFHLSGGLDSGAIAALAARHGQQHTFAVRFGDPSFDEGPAAARTARAIGADHTEIAVPAVPSAELLTEAIVRGQMIPENAHGAARLLHSRSIRAAGFRVALAGEGGDEMFAGYPQSIRDLTAGAGTASLAALKRQLALSDAGRPLVNVAETLGFLPGFVLDRYLGVGGPIQEILRPDFLAEVLTAQPCRDLLADPHVADQLEGRTTFHRGSYLFAKTWLANYLLAAERLDMAHGVEVRLPFLDHRLHEVVRHTPLSWFTDGPHSKPLLRAALRDDVPTFLGATPKRPFLAPAACTDEAFLHTVQRLVEDGALDQQPFFSRRKVVGLLDRVRESPPVRRAGYERVVQIVAGVAVLTSHFSLAA